MIFDGTGPPDKSCFQNTSNMEIFFVGVRTDADTVIEDKISVNSAPKRLRVVSSDNRLIKAARKRKAVAVKSELFWSQVIKQLSRKRGISEPLAKRGGLSESETDRWLNEFGF
jgi:predicted RNA-binding protein with PIN domain